VCEGGGVAVGGQETFYGEISVGGFFKEGERNILPLFEKRSEIKV